MVKKYDAGILYDADSPLMTKQSKEFASTGLIAFVLTGHTYVHMANKAVLFLIALQLLMRI